MNIKLSPDKLRRKYNAVYRLRKKLNCETLEKRTQIIYTNDFNLLNISEVKILINEFGFVIQPELFKI